MSLTTFYVFSSGNILASHIFRASFLRFNICIPKNNVKYITRYMRSYMSTYRVRQNIRGRKLKFTIENEHSWKTVVVAALLIMNT